MIRFNIIFHTHKEMWHATICNCFVLVSEVVGPLSVADFSSDRPHPSRAGPTVPRVDTQIATRRVRTRVLCVRFYTSGLCLVLLSSNLRFLTLIIYKTCPVGIEVLTEPTMKDCTVVPCSLETARRFGGQSLRDTRNYKSGDRILQNLPPFRVLICTKVRQIQYLQFNIVTCSWLRDQQ
jgi:hypothetical protein